MPVPVPALETLRESACSTNVALTVVAAFIVTAHVPVPLHPPPDHPAKMELLAEAAVSVTDVPCGYGSVQSLPQAMPAGEEVTVPAPVPSFATVNVCCTSAKVADTVAARSTVTTQVPVPLQPAPDHPVNAEFVDGDAARVTVVPNAKEDAHCVPQLMPAGLETTLPVPLPDSVTVIAAGSRLN